MRLPRPRRWRFPSRRRADEVAVPPAWRSIGVLVTFAVAGGAIAIGLPVEGSRDVVAVEAGPGASETGPGPDGGGRSTTTPLGDRADLPGDQPALECAAGRNGGDTDTGVTASEIKLGATVVDSGIGASFLRDARYGMLAVVNQVNRAGGICGRTLRLSLVDDGWDFQRGQAFIRSLVEEENVFALLVVPSSEGLKAASSSGYFEREQVPVVGSDGMLVHQYTDPFIWPVAASTLSTMHVMAKHAFDEFGATKFGIVYEHDYHFGIEGAFAFNAAVKRLTGDDIPGYSNPLHDPRCQEQFCGIRSGQDSYATQIQTFNSSCGCDFVALLLEPETALVWMGGGGLQPSESVHMGGVQPLFTRHFAEGCAKACDGLWLWTGFHPPIGSNLGRPGIARFVEDIKRTRETADYTNTFVQGAYVGATLLVQALRAVGPLLTRERLMAELDRTLLRTSLTDPLRWSPGSHFANVRMRAYSIQYKGRFNGWRDERTSVRDPWVGKDIPPE
ncbi:MAG TPA: ABC transporter substrate-binding protein [Actinomycetota bacterium]